MTEYPTLEQWIKNSYGGVIGDGDLADMAESPRVQQQYELSRAVHEAATAWLNVVRPMVEGIKAAVFMIAESPEYKEIEKAMQSKQRGESGD